MTSVTRPRTEKLAGRKHLKPTKTLLFAAFLLAVLAMSNIASASIRDPRKCSGGPSTFCAHNAAKIVARRYLAKAADLQVPLWQGPMSCVSSTSILRWACRFESTLPIGSGWATVTYKATSAGWTVRVSIVR